MPLYLVTASREPRGKSRITEWQDAECPKLTMNDR